MADNKPRLDRKFRTQRDARITRDIAAGEPTVAIARRYGVSVASVNRIVRATA